MYSVPLKKLNNLLEKVKEKPLFDFSTPEYRLGSMIMDIAYHRLFKPTQTENTAHAPRHFFKLQYANKGIDAVNISNILNHKKVQSCIPPYFKIKSTPCISYNYTSTVASKLFNYKQTLEDLDIEHLKDNPPTCSCSSAPYN